MVPNPSSNSSLLILFRQTCGPKATPVSIDVRSQHDHADSCATPVSIDALCSALDRQSDSCKPGFPGGRLDLLASEAHARCHRSR